MWGLQGGKVLEAAAVLKVAPTELRACGLSQAKANYIYDLAQRFQSGQLSTEAIVGGCKLNLHRPAWDLRRLA
jgi:3-methyladenine DNA glycosylase/8-oxoguanine DNA glycosylase